MGLRFRDLVVDVLWMAPAPAGPCGCTATAPQCTRGGSKNPNPNPPPNRPKPGPKPTKRALGDLEALRRQLRSSLAQPG